MALRVAGRVWAATGRTVLCGRTVNSTPALSLAGGDGPRRGYAMRLELTEHGILWRRPEHVPSWRPEVSGDLKPRTLPDPARPRMGVMPAAAVLEELDEVTKQLLSLKFCTQPEHNKVEEYEVLRTIRRHKYDNNSFEVQIAKMTVKIRRLQASTFRCRSNTIERVNLLETIDRRNRLLRKLRNHDYKRFEWLIEELGILFRPFADQKQRRNRKEGLRRLVRLHGKELREKRLAEYREKLEKQKEPFLKEKAETLHWIANTEMSLNLPVSVSVPGETGDTDTQQEKPEKASSETTAT